MESEEELPESEEELLEQRRRNQETAKQMRASARKLYREQQNARGIVKRTDHNDQKITAPGPYRATPEGEGRARQIMYLRRAAATLEAS